MPLRSSPLHEAAERILGHDRTTSSSDFENWH
jgi:hypothetical protein